MAVRLTLASAVLVVALAAPPAALAKAFQRDQTPLPSGVLEDSGSGGAADQAASSSTSGGLVRMIVGLFVVLAVIYGAYLLARSYRKSRARGPSDGRMEIVATTALGPNRAVHLIRVGEEHVLVGSAEHGVTKLRVYDADESTVLAPLLDSSATMSRLSPAARAARGGGGRFMRAIEDARWRTVR